MHTLATLSLFPSNIRPELLHTHSPTYICISVCIFLRACTGVCKFVCISQCTLSTNYTAFLVFLFVFFLFLNLISGFLSVTYEIFGIKIHKTFVCVRVTQHTNKQTTCIHTMYIMLLLSLQLLLVSTYLTLSFSCKARLWCTID